MKADMRIAVFAAALALMVCGMDLTAGERARPTTHTVTMDGMKFKPDVLTVAPGDTVVWVNEDLVAHTATSQAGAFDSKLIAPGKSWKLTVRKQGSFAYICTYHPTMKAMLRVE
jgi:plastocyanin